MKGRCVLQTVRELLEGVSSGEWSVDDAIRRLQKRDMTDNAPQSVVSRFYASFFPLADNSVSD